MASFENRRERLARAWAARVSRSWAEEQVSSMAAASAAASPEGTRRPETPSVTISAMPPTSVDTTGVPSMIASWTDSGIPSQIDERQNTSAAAMTSATSSRKPRKRTSAASPLVSAARLNADSSGPSPTRASNGLLVQAARASNKTSSAFCGASRATVTTRQRPSSSSPRSARTSARVRVTAGGSSTPR